MVEVTGRDLRTLLFCSIRYALGRRSYMPGLVQDLVKEYVEVLSLSDRYQLANEIETAPSLGDENIDAPRWREFADWLRKERNG